MCLAIPGCILDIEGDDSLARSGRVDFGGVVKKVNLSLVPEAQVGDHVLVHVGLAISVVDAGEAERTWELLRSLEDELPDVVEWEGGGQ